MGARIPPKDRPRRGGLKCEFCGRAVPSVQALRSHQNSLHSKALKDKTKQKPLVKRLGKGVKPKKVIEKVAEKPESKVITAKPKSGEYKSNILRNKNRSSVDRSKATATETKKVPAEGNNMGPKTNKDLSTEFQCPICKKCFPVLFSAHKHIQKYHPTNSDEKGSLTIKPVAPIQLDHCRYCDDKFVSPHVCPNRPQPGLGLWYECIGCLQRFKTNKLFDIHVSDVHGDGCESMFFPSKEEFNTWKKQMQSQTECTFTIMGQYNSKQIYRCCNLPNDTDEDVVRFCPATIVCSAFPKGFQVNFYSTHYEHKSKKYTLSDQYKSYSISDLIQQAGGEPKELNADDTDLYLQFKTLMDSIVFDAAKINIDTLKVLVSKALEMTSVLTQYDEDEDVLTTVNTSTLICTPSPKDDGITKALAGLRSKRKGVEENGVDSKKKRNNFSLADNKDSDKILKELDTDNKAKSKDDDDVENVKIKFDKKSNQSPSFVDSYKQFVDTTIRKATLPKKKTVVKTKMGQFKPELSPKKQPSLGRAKDIEYEVKERENDCNILILKI